MTKTFQRIYLVALIAPLNAGCNSNAQTVHDEFLLEPTESFHAVGVDEPVVEYLDEPGFANC